MKKFFITLMCIIMVVCFMPTVALAGATSSCTAGDSCTTHVAKIGPVHYDTIEDAISAASAGDTITLIKDAVITPEDSGEKDALSPQISIDGKNITLDLNGFTISNDSTVAGYSFKCTPAMFAVINNAVLTITGSGKIDAELGNNNSYGITINGGTVIVEKSESIPLPYRLYGEKGRTT